MTPPGRLPAVDWRELWQYRDLFAVLAWRDISVRYKQTAVGALWAILQPFVQMVVFTFVFNGLGRIDSGDGTPYPIFVFVGLLIWQYYAGTLTNASASMVANAAIIQKVYFPRLIVPVTAATTGLVDLIVAVPILAGLMAYYGYAPRPAGLLLLPLLLAITVAASLGAGLFLASLNTRYRDVRYALPFAIQVLMFLTPVIYPVQALGRYPAARALVLWLNPIAGVIDAARASLLGRGAVDWHALAISSLVSILFLVLGLSYFRSTERYFADIV